jgi:hypothetical protein
VGDSLDCDCLDNASWSEDKEIMMAEDTIITVMVRNSLQKWLSVRGLEPQTTRADFFRQICYQLHPDSHLIRNPDLDVLFGLHHMGMDAWTQTLSVNEALTTFWTTPCISRRRTCRRDHVSLTVAMLLRFVLDIVSKFMPEGNWSLPHSPFCGVGTPGYDLLRVWEIFASFC